MHCLYCYKNAQFKCGSCLESSYCSKDCQKLDWLNHKVECELIEGQKRERDGECHNEFDPFTLETQEEDHFDMYLGDFKYCFDFDPLALWFLKSAMDPEENTVDSDDFHLGYPESIRLLVQRYGSESAYWPKAVVPGLNFTKDILMDFADQYEIYLSKYPEKRYKFEKYIVIFGIDDYSDILYTEDVKVLNNDIYNSYNSSIEKILKKVRTNLIPYTWVNFVNIHYRLIEKYDEQRYSVINLNRDFLNDSLKKWTKTDVFIIRINLNINFKKLPNFILTLLLPDLKVERIVFNQMTFIYFIKFLFDTSSKDFSNLISDNIFNLISKNYIGSYKLSFLFDYNVKVKTIEFLKVQLDPNSDLKNLNAWKINLHVVIIELKKYYTTLNTQFWLSMVNQKEWELLIRINSQSI